MGYAFKSVTAPADWFHHYKKEAIRTIPKGSESVNSIFQDAKLILLTPQLTAHNKNQTERACACTECARNI